MSDRKIIHSTPTYEVSVGSAFFCVIESRNDTTITYEKEVIQTPTIKTLGITRNTSSLEVWASGILFDYITQTSGADINLGAVSLPDSLINKLEGASEQYGFTLNRVNDIEKEFAFGYWGENRDGSLVFYWHPVCKITPTEETKQTRQGEPQEPERSYSIKVIPYGSGGEGGLWRLKYSQTKAKELNKPVLSIEDFFIEPFYTERQIENLMQEKVNTIPDVTPPIEEDTEQEE